jgi:hypothetical protein
MKIHLVNHIDEPINLHFQSLPTSPLGNSDNVHVIFDPQDSYDYEVKIP